MLNKRSHDLKYFVLIIFILSLSINAQEKPLSKSDFQNELKKLEAKKDSLLLEKQKLQDEIKLGKETIENLDKSIADCGNKYYDEKISRLTKKYGKKDAMMIAANKIWKGMTIEMLRESWGEPDSKHEDSFSYGTFTQLKYGEIEFFFRDNKLIDWEEKK